MYITSLLKLNKAVAEYVLSGLKKIRLFFVCLFGLCVSWFQRSLSAFMWNAIKKLVILQYAT